MVTEVFVVYNDDKHIKRIGDADIKASPFFHFIDDRTPQGRKDSYKIKGSWGSRITPFALCMNGEQAVKAFYSETGEDVIKSLIDYLNEDSCTG